MTKQKVVIVTGASSGIGQATATYFAAKGHKVYGLSRRGTSDGSFVGVSCDVTDFSAVSACFAQIVADEGRIDVLVNNAGMGISGAAEHIDPQQTESLYRLNTLALTECTRLALPYLRQSKGMVVNISSVAAVVPIPYQTAYSCSKAAVNMFTEALRLELNGSGVRVCAIRKQALRTRGRKIPTRAATAARSVNPFRVWNVTKKAVAIRRVWQRWCTNLPAVKIRPRFVQSDSSTS